MIRYLDPRYDMTFKKVFGEHKHLCISLINSMIPFDEDRKVIDIEYTTGEIIPLIPALRDSIVDVRCIDNYGRQFLVEMQMQWDDSFKSRVLFNSSMAYVVQLYKGKKVELIDPIYSLNFLNQNFEKSPEMKDEYLHHYKIVNIMHTNKQIKGLEFVFVELPKFKPVNRSTGKLHDLWMRFLTEINESTKEVPQELLSNEDTCEAVKYMEEAAYTVDQILAYGQLKIDAWTLEQMDKNKTEAGRVKGLAEGLEKGMAEGLEKGTAEGLEKGTAEGLEKGREEAIISHILKMRQKNMSDEDIMEITGLSEEKLKSLFL